MQMRPAGIPENGVVHELAHFREKEHNRAFYRLCERMEPSYFQLEFDMLLYLTYLKRIRPFTPESVQRIAPASELLSVMAGH